MTQAETYAIKRERELKAETMAAWDKWVSERTPMAGMAYELARRAWQAYADLVRQIYRR